MALLGKSGSERSTLLNMIGGLDRPSAGSIRVESNHIYLTAEAAAAFHVRTM